MASAGPAGSRVFDVVIVGGGVFGTAIAFYLAGRRAGSVLLLEQTSIGAGATGWTSGIVRVHYTNPHEARLALASWRIFRDWKAQVGGDCGFVPTGFVRMVSVDQADRLARNVEMLRSLGADVTWIAADEIPNLQPYLSTEGLGGAAYEPHGGYAVGTDTASAFAAGAAARGARIQQGTAVRGLRVERDRVVGVETSDGFVAAGRVVLAAGPWSIGLLRAAGLELPLRTKLIRAGLVHNPAAMAAPNGFMTVLDESSGTYLKPDGHARTDIGLRYEWDVPPSYETTAVPQEFLADGVAHLVRRVPAFEDAGLVQAWGAVDGYSADGAPIVGAAPGIDGLYLAIAASGTGFKISPAIGIGMAELLTIGRGETIDLAPFRATRFAEGARFGGATDYTRPKWRHQPLGAHGDVTAV